MIKTRSDNKNLFLIISTSLIMKAILIVFILLMIGSLSDTYDMNLYYHAAQNILGGNSPWANSNDLFDYPILSLIPMVLSYWISQIVGGGFNTFLYSMQIFMNVCDTIICISVYYIGKKLYSNQSALKAALLCAASISVAYYTLYKFDSFPSMLLILSILFTLYNDRTKGYISSVIGMFVKIFPIIAYPFLWIYNAKEGKSNATVILGIGVSIFVGLMLIGYDKFIMITGFNYCNTIQYTLSQFIGSFDFLPLLFKVLMIGIIIASLYKMIVSKKSPRLMIQLIFVCLLAVIFLSAYRSPQYIVWFAPLAALLICNDKVGILSYIALQIFSFIEYPFAYGMIYDNQHYLYSSTAWFFVLYFAVLGILVWRCCKPKPL
jgi:hypothetical protein